MSQHFKELCQICNTIINQCRCPADDKFIKYSICDKCKSNEQNNNEVKKVEAIEEFKLESMNKEMVICYLYGYKDIRSDKYKKNVIYVNNFIYGEDVIIFYKEKIYKMQGDNFDQKTYTANIKNIFEYYEQKEAIEKKELEYKKNKDMEIEIELNKRNARLI